MQTCLKLSLLISVFEALSYRLQTCTEALVVVFFFFVQELIVSLCDILHPFCIHYHFQPTVAAVHKKEKKKYTKKQSASCAV